MMCIHDGAHRRRIDGSSTTMLIERRSSSRHVEHATGWQVAMLFEHATG
jgi:hypothetical protein